MTGGAARRLLAGAAAVAVTIAGCTSPSSSSNRHGSQGRLLVSVDGGTVHLAVSSVPDTLNDHTVAGDTPVGRAVASLIWGQVFRVGPGTAPTLDTDVVKSAELVSLAPQTVVYQINPAAVWSDGTPVTAQDFVYNWVSQAGSATDVDGTPDSVASSAGYRDIASVVGSNGGKTVTVVFTSPYADWPSLFSDLLPAHVAERVGWNHGFDRFDPSSFVSAGPYMVGAWTPGSSLTLVRNPHWWGTQPHVSSIVLEAVADQSVAAALRSNQVQMAAPSQFDASFLAQVSSSATLQSQVNLGATMLQLDFNVRRPVVDNQSVRQGIAHLVDRAGIVSQLVQPLAPLAWEDNDHLFANMQAWYSDDAAGYDQPDALAATRALTAGGLVPDGHGTWTTKGGPVTLTLAWAADDGWSALVAPAIAAQLVAGGFDVVSDPVPGAAFYGSVLPQGAFDLALVPVRATAYPSELAHVFGAPTPPANTPAVGTAPGDTATTPNVTGFDDPRVDAAFAQAAQQLAAAQARLLYQQIDALLWTAMPSLPLFAEPTVLAWSTSLASVRDDSGGLGPLWSARQWAQLVPEGPVASTTTTARNG